MGSQYHFFTVTSTDTVVVPDCAKMIATLLFVTAVVPTLKVALVFPAGTVTIMGRTRNGGSAVADFEIRTSSPLEGAAALIVTVPVRSLPPTTLLGLKESLVTSTPGVTVMEALTLLLPRVAVTRTPESLSTNSFVVFVKVALVAPAGTVTLSVQIGVQTPGNFRTVTFSTSPTTDPPAGAGPLRVTVPEYVPPLGMLVGVNVKDTRVAVEAEAEELTANIGTKKTASETSANILPILTIKIDRFLQARYCYLNKAQILLRM